PASEATGGAADPEEHGEEAGSGPDAGGAEPDGGTTDDGPAPGETPAGPDGHGLPEGSPGGGAEKLHAKTVRACRAYRDDGMSRKEERRLLELAKGERDLVRFCDRVLGEDRGTADGSGDGKGNTGDGKGSGAGNTGDGKGSGAGNTGDGGSGRGGEGGHGSLPSVSFGTAAPRSAPDHRDEAQAPA
ncbi:hypothetical protein ABZ371_32505, partial [Streptomyces sp. NPDC005899]